MPKVYAILIIKGLMTFDQVPDIIQPKVKAVLEAPWTLVNLLSKKLIVRN